MERTQKGRLQNDNHKILDYEKHPEIGRYNFRSQKIILWKETEKRPLSRPHVFVGVMPIGEAMKKYLCSREDAILDPGSGTSWMLVPRIGYEKNRMAEDDMPRHVVENIADATAQNLDEYLLVKRKSWMVPKPGRPVDFKGGRGGAKLIHIDKATTGSNLSVLLAKAYFFLEKTHHTAEFHVHLSKRLRHTSSQMLDKLLTMPGGLALHPTVIQRQLPAYTHISVRPMSNGRELVWVVGRDQDQDDWISRAKKEMASLEGTHAFAMKRGREMRKDRNARLIQDQREIARLRMEGESFEHILERQKEIETREANLKAMFTEINLTRRAKEKASKMKRLANRIAYKASVERKATYRLEQKMQLNKQHWDQSRLASLLANLKRARIDRQGRQEGREAMMKTFLGSRNARREEQRAKFLSTTVNYHSKPLQIGARKVEPGGGSGSGKSTKGLRITQFKKTTRDVARRGLLLRPSRPTVPTVSGVRMKQESTLKRRKWLHKRREGNPN